MPFKSALGSGTATLSGNIVTIFITNPIAVGDLVVVRVAADNLSATTPTLTATDTGGNTYTNHHQLYGPTATAAGGVAGALLVTKATNAVATGGGITVSLSGAVLVKAAYAESFTGFDNVTRSAPVGSSRTNGVVGPNTSGTVESGDLVLAWHAQEGAATAFGLTGDSDTLNGAWSTITGTFTTGGSTFTRVQVGGQWKIPTAAGAQTHQGGGLSDDCVGGIVVLRQTIVEPPVPPDHVKISGLLYCVPAHGVAIRVEIQTPTELIEATDMVVRATWQQGGAYDAGGSPWFNPTPNPCELELTVDDDQWDPTTVPIGGYDIRPLVTTVQIFLAENITIAGGTTWLSQRRFWGPVLAYAYQPNPGGGATVTISAADALTNVGDMVPGERPEEAPWERLAYLATGVNNLSHGFQVGVGLDTPLMGRYHPDQRRTRLEHMTDVAMAAGQALMFQPSDQTLTATTSVTAKPQGTFSNPGVVLRAAVDPDAGMTHENGDTPAGGAANRVACLTDIVLAYHDAGFRTRIRSARTIAPWTISVSTPGPIPSLPPGSHFWQSASFGARAGDKFELIAQAWAPVTWTLNPPPTYRGVTNPYAVPGAGPVVYKDQQFAHPDLWSGAQVLVNYSYEVPPGMAGQFVIGRYLIVAGGNVNIPASYTETVRRLAGSGVDIETISTTRETTYGQRAVTGWSSPIADQANLDAWNTRALGWVTAPGYYPRLARIATSVGHPSPGSKQWAVHLYAGQRLALRHIANTAFNLPTINTWAVNVSTTFTPTEITLDVECGPPTSGVA